jgi:hypothetical protein
MNANERKCFVPIICQISSFTVIPESLWREHLVSPLDSQPKKSIVAKKNNVSKPLFAFICVMHMDVRMPRAQDAQELRNLRTYAFCFY